MDNKLTRNFSFLIGYVWTEKLFLEEQRAWRQKWGHNIHDKSAFTKGKENTCSLFTP